VTGIRQQRSFPGCRAFSLRRSGLGYSISTLGFRVPLSEQWDKRPCLISGGAEFFPGAHVPGLDGTSPTAISRRCTPAGFGQQPYVLRCDLLSGHPITTRWAVRRKRE
jgi:hypothetical protein